MSQQSYTYCTITSNTPIGKKYDADLNKTQLPVYSGRAEVWSSDIVGIGEHFEEMDDRVCLTVGTPRVGECFITTKAKEVEGAMQRGLPLVARSDDNWQWPNEPGLLLFDHDPDHWTFDPLETVAAVVAKIGEALGVDLSQHDYVARPSASSCIWQDDEEVRGVHGVHVYVGVACLADIDANALSGLAFQNGFGCGGISLSGAILKRTVFDSAVHKAPNGIAYAGDPHFEGTHESRRAVIVNEGVPLDLKSVQGNLRGDRAEEAWSAIRAALGGPAAKVFDEYVTAREEQGLSREAVESAFAGELPGTWPIVFDDGTTAKIWEIMQAPLKYNGRTDVRDPLEPEYGESKAKIFIQDGAVTIHSFAHGGRTYRCLFDIESIGEVIKANPKLLESWGPLVGQLGAEYKAPEIVDALKEAGVDETKTALRERVKRLQRQSARKRAKAGDWPTRYLFLTEGGKFLNLPTLERFNLITTMGAQAFNIVHSRHNGPNGESPAAFLVGARLIPTAERIVYEPPVELGGALPLVDESFNAWRPGPAVERFDGEPMLWLKLLHELVPVEAERESLLDWMAFALQYPGAKCNWQIVMQGTEGLGKDSLFHPLRWGMGYHNTKDVTTAELLGDFHHYLVGGPKLIILQELDAAHKAATRNKLKPLAAAPPLAHVVNQKNEKPIYVMNMQALVVFTNTIHPFSLDAGDRRWYMLHCPGTPLPPAFFRQLWAWYNGGGVRDVAGFLAARDLSAFDPVVLPGSTEYKDLVIELSNTSYHMAIRDMLASADYQVLTTPWVVRQMDAMGEKVTQKQVVSVLSELGWRPVKPTAKVEGKVCDARGWASPACKLVGRDLFEAIFKVKNMISG